LHTPSTILWSIPFTSGKRLEVRAACSGDSHLLKIEVILRKEDGKDIGGLPFKLGLEDRVDAASTEAYG